MATSTLISVEEYLRSDYSPDCDYLDGEVVERNMGEQIHGALQVFFATLFSNNRRVWNVRVLVEQRVQVTRNNFRIADVCVLRAEDPRDPIVVAAPLICVEILSREQTLRVIQLRATDYHAMGVANIWVVDPVRRICWVADAAGKLRETESDFRVERTEIVVPLEAIWQELDDLAAGR